MTRKDRDKIIIIAFSIICVLPLAQAAAQEEWTESVTTLEEVLIESGEQPFNLMNPSAREEPEPAEVLKSPISITLVSKSLLVGNPMEGNVSDQIDFIFDFTSYLQKDIEAFRGVLVLKDPVGQELLEVELIVDDAIKAGRILGWRGSVDYDPSLDTHRRLLTTDKNDLKVELALQEVTYTDGSNEVFY
ncbi:MAG: hypothetical protein JSU92_06685 [Deltaproteobacteria bacterium]|nr:MAG: hypothetical protein JSU92_06685 [Deltaproteobacteria bacterium]